MPAVRCRKPPQGGALRVWWCTDVDGWQERRKTERERGRKRPAANAGRENKTDTEIEIAEREGSLQERPCTWLESTHLRYTWAPLWALRAHYRKTGQNRTQTITHRDRNTRSSKNLRLSCTCGVLRLVCFFIIRIYLVWIKQSYINTAYETNIKLDFLSVFKC